MAANEQVCSGSFAETGRRHLPELARVDGRAFEVQHVVILGNQVEISSAASHSNELGDHLVWIRDGMEDVTAHREVEGAVCRVQFVNALMFEFQARREICE